MTTRIRDSGMQTFASAVSTVYASESISGFYDRYLQEVGAWTEVGNAFVEAEIIIEGHSLGPSRSDWRNRFTDQYTVPVVLANLSYQKR